MARNMVKDATETDLNMFTEIEGFDLPMMPADLEKASKVHRFKKNSSVFCIPLKGTTFSGHPTRTTLGNTFRSLLYMYYYLEQSGFKDPWAREDMFVAASGDDTVVWAEKSILRVLKESIESLTASDKTVQVVGLGQIVKDVKIGEYYEADFCSKWSFVTNPLDIDTWTMTRDLNKVINTRMYYYKDNKIIHALPAIHAMAIYD